MTDEEYLFRQTEKERKRIGYGAKHKKRGGGRYVRLPSDNLTKKEREALNGEIKTYKEKAFYTWQEFKKLPSDIQVKWVNSLVNTYGVGLEAISVVVFGNGEKTLRNYLTRSGDSKYINKALQGRASVKAKKKLEAAFDAWKNTEVTMCEDDLPDETARIQAIIDREKEEMSNFKIVDHKLVPCEIAEPVQDEQIDEKPRNLENIGALIQALRGTGARLTIEVTL